MRKKISIRVDGNEIIATGHVMRCLSIAEQLKKQDVEVKFVVADDRSCGLIEQKGFAVDVLGSAWNDLNQEVDKMINYIQTNTIDVLLVDSYFVTQQYMKRLSECTKVIYIDDLSKEIYPVHAIIKYNLFEGFDEYKKKYYAQGIGTQFLMGSEYTPLRQEFEYEPYDTKPNVSQVLITTGGTDQLNVAYNLLQMFLSDARLQKMEYHVIVGCFNQNKDILQQMQNDNKNIHLHENVNRISEWMRKCDVAITAAGTTTYELCACGTPSICLAVADNQAGAIKWEKHGYVRYAGNAAMDMQGCMRTCKDILLEYMDNYEIRKEQSSVMQSLVDGHGARRIAEYMTKI